MGKFCMAKVVQVAWGQNRHTDSSATLASAITEDIPWIIKVEFIIVPSKNTITDVSVVRIRVTTVSAVEPCWMDPIVDFLAEDCMLDDEKEASRVR